MSMQFMPCLAAFIVIVYCLTAYERNREDKECLKELLFL
jgi:hypothetical protein